MNLQINRICTIEYFVLLYYHDFRPIKENYSMSSGRTGCAKGMIDFLLTSIDRAFYKRNIIFNIRILIKKLVNLLSCPRHFRFQFRLDNNTRVPYETRNILDLCTYLWRLDCSPLRTNQQSNIFF